MTGNGADSPQPKATPLRVFLLGGFGGGNFGNDASLEAALLWVRTECPGAAVACISTDPKKVLERFGVSGPPLRVTPKTWIRLIDTLLLRQPSLWFNWWLSIRALRACDLLIVAGGGVFHDFRDRPWGWPSCFLRWMWAARLSGVRVVMVSVGAGLIINPLSKVLLRWAAKAAHQRSYRDTESKDFMQALGVDESASMVLPDLAFLPPAPRHPARAAEGPLIVGLGLMNYRGWRTNAAIYAAYIEANVRLVHWLDARGHRLRLVIGQTPTDLEAVTDLGKHVGRAWPSADERQMASLHDVSEALINTDIVVAARFHVQIAAFRLRRPVLALSYGPMSDSLMNAVGLGDFTHDINDVDVDRLLDQFNLLCDRRADYAKLIDARVGALEAKLPCCLQSLRLI